MNINDVITEYLHEKQIAADAKKRADALKAMIINHAGAADNFKTDVYTVVIKTTTSNRLDTEALYRDFPDIKEVYSHPTTSKTITAVVTADAEGKTA